MCSFVLLLTVKCQHRCHLHTKTKLQPAAKRRNCTEVIVKLIYYHVLVEFAHENVTSRVHMLTNDATARSQIA